MEAIYFSARVKCGMVLDLFLLPCTTPSLSKYLCTAFYQSKNTDDAEKRIDTFIFFILTIYSMVKFCCISQCFNCFSKLENPYY